MFPQALEVQANAAATAAAAAVVRVWTSPSRDAIHFHFCDKDKVCIHKLHELCFGNCGHNGVDKWWGKILSLIIDDHDENCPGF